MIARIRRWFRKPEPPGKPQNALWYKVLALHIRSATK